MNVQVPSMAPGDGSLPADLRAGRAGYYSNGRTRLLMGQRGTGMRVEPQIGMGEIMRGVFVVPQNPIVTPNSNPVTVRLNTGGSGVGRLMRLAGIGDVCNSGDPDYDPAACEEEGGIITATVTTSDPAGGSGVQLNLPPISTPVVLPQPNTGSGVQLSFPQYGLTTTVPSGYTGQASYAPGQVPPQAPAGYQWAQVTNQAGQTLAQVLAVAQGGASITLPNGNKLIYGSPASAATAGTAGALAMSPVSPSVLLLLGGVFLVFMISKGR